MELIYFREKAFLRKEGKKEEKKPRGWKELYLNRRPYKSLSLGTLISAFLISYARARSEGLGESCNTGIMERPERIILLIFATITG